jgi:hypothetical protein
LEGRSGGVISLLTDECRAPTSAPEFLSAACLDVAARSGGSDSPLSRGLWRLSGHGDAADLAKLWCDFAGAPLFADQASKILTA